MGKLQEIVSKVKNSKGISDVAKRSAGVAGGVLGAAAALSLADEIVDHISKVRDKGKMKQAILYAKKEHPELAAIPEEKLEKWLEAAYVISPKIVGSDKLAADTLYQIHQYGGRIDLATAKILSDITRGTSGKKDWSEKKLAPSLNLYNNI